MNCLLSFFRRKNILPASTLLALVTFTYAQNPGVSGSRSRGSVGSQGPLPVHEIYASAVIESGGSLFQQNCAFCHGKDAGGGESGPDLTRSKLVSSDVKGENIGTLIKNGRPEKGMPRFNLPDAEVTSLVAFVHSQQDKAMSQSGTRKGVDETDLQTGDAETGKQYFNGAGTCATCHSATGDLAGIASRYQGLKLEEQMLNPRDAKSNVTVTTSSGKVVTGQVAYLDEFTVALIDSTGQYRSWPVINVKYKVDAPANAHIDLLSKYTDADIHNLMAYLQTLR
jgi:cytochrome c oxidase cbb3-type subunit 3